MHNFNFTRKNKVCYIKKKAFYMVDHYSGFFRNRYKISEDYTLHVVDLTLNMYGTVSIADLAIGEMISRAIE